MIYKSPILREPETTIDICYLHFRKTWTWWQPVSPWCPDAVVISDATRLRGAAATGTFWVMSDNFALKTQKFFGRKCNVTQEMVNDRNSCQVDILHSLVVKIRLGNYCRWRVMISGLLACEQPFAGTPNSEGVSLLTRIMYYSRGVLEWKKDCSKSGGSVPFFGCFEVKLLL